MPLLYLPIEIFEQILRDAILVRGRKRGLRLRLVNQLFSEVVIAVIYRLRLLEQLPNENRTFYPLFVFAPYLAYQVMHATGTGNALMMCLKKVAIEVHSDTLLGTQKTSTLENTVEKLCSSRMKSQLSNIGPDFEKIFDPKDVITVQEYEEHLFAAAIRTNKLAVVQRCVKKNPKLLSLVSRPRYGTYGTLNPIFGRYPELAANYANTNILAYLLSTNVDCVDTHLRRDLFMGAAKAGRADIVSFLYDFKREEVPWNILYSPVDPLTAHYIHRPAYPGFLHSAQETPSLEVIEYIDVLLPIWSLPATREYTLACALESAACDGRLDTVKYLVERGVPPMGRPQYNRGYWGNIVAEENMEIIGAPLNRPIQNAVKYGHMDVMDYLLEQGAGGIPALESAAASGAPDLVRRILDKGFASDDAILKAAGGGYTTIVQPLLDRAVDLDGCVESKPAETSNGKKTWMKHPLVSAIEKENTSMFRALVEQKPSARFEKTMKECVLQAKNDGLESMLILLSSYGVDVSEGA